MSVRSRSLRALVAERLTAAAEEVFALVERTMAEYEEELSRSKEENQRKQQLLDSVLSKMLVHRTDAEAQTETESEYHHQDPLEPPQVAEPPENPTQTFHCPVKTEHEEQAGSRVDTEPPGLSAAQPLKAEEDGDREEALPPPLASEAWPAVSTATPPADRETAKKHECCFCGRKFREERNLQRHIVLHTRQKPFCCPVCSRCFSQEETLRLHMALHSEGPPAAAAATAAPPPGAHAHISAAGPAKATPFSCPLCSKCFTRTFSLQSHMLTHTGEKPFPCPLCSTRFNRKSNLNRHLKVHAHKYHSV